MYKALKKWSEGVIPGGKTIADVNSGATDIVTKSSKFSPSDAQREAILQACSDVVEFTGNSTLVSLVRENLYQLGLMRPLADRLDEYRREHQAILLSDTNKIINSIIEDTDSPFLYEKIGNRFEHYLIDEFQDTSKSQWENLRPLLLETDSNGHDSLIIGDVKQSIYRFRDSDATLLMNLPDEFENSVVTGDEPSENTNWRSLKEIVYYNNTLFRYLAAALGFSSLYSNVEQQVSPANSADKGMVEINIFDEKKIKEQDRDTPEIVTRHILRHICRQINAGYKPCEIAILVRTKAEGENIIAHLRRMQGEDPAIPRFRMISDKSLLIKTVPSVAFLISTLRLLSASDGKQSAKDASQREQAFFVNEFESNLMQTAECSSALKQAVGKINALKEGPDAISLPELPEMANLDMSSLVEMLIGTMSEDVRRRDNLALTTLQDLVTTFVGRGHSDIRAFLEWWDERGHKTSIPAGKDQEAINILTIHKSKGLEWKCVFVPYAAFNRPPFADIKWFDIRGLISGISADTTPPFVPIRVKKDLENTLLRSDYESLKKEETGDRINLLYVALTRATDELIVGLTNSPSTEIGKEQLDVIDQVMAELKGTSETPADDSEGEEESFIEKTYLYGAPTSPRKENKSTPTAIEPVDSVIIPEYHVEPGRDMWENTKIESENFNHIDVARERGVIVHEIMAAIRTQDDLEEALRRFRLTVDGVNMSQRDFEALSDLIRLRVKNPQAKKWFDSSARRILME
ncbi:MAG: UvrD-helicase domain-containing protein, partial [Duncaniella sp.]|nr:UvrD-helicase domain-containing protein [Duncaniella sp.]